MNRSLYIEKLVSYIGSREVKVLTGVRGAGKSSIFATFQQRLLYRGINSGNIIYIDFEQIEYGFITDSIALYEYITNKIKPNDEYYLILDEVQQVKDWQKVVIALKMDFNIDIYLSSSGRNLIDNEFRRQLKHKPIEIEVLPLSFKEYRNFTDPDGLKDIKESFDEYLEIWWNTCTAAIYQRCLLLNNGTRCLYTQQDSRQQFDSAIDENPLYRDGQNTFIQQYRQNLERDC